MQNTGKRCVIVLVFIILRWSFNYESNVFRYNKILIDCVFGNSKFVVLSTLTIDLGFASFNSQGLGDNKLAIPSYPVNKYLIHLGNVLFSCQKKNLMTRLPYGILWHGSYRESYMVPNLATTILVYQYCGRQVQLIPWFS
jgi:hypothetical protein